MCDADTLPQWAPRVPRWKIRRLYETDAQGIYDKELIDDVGYALLMRCDSFVAASEAAAGKVRCPRCATTIQRHGDKEELLHCDCGWQLPWGEYLRTIQHKQLSGAEPVLRLFRSYIDGFAAASTPRERMLQIDRLIHGFHYYLNETRVTRPVAVNLIEGRLRDVVAFLDRLSYGDKSTPGVRETKATWDEGIEANRAWYYPEGDSKEG